MNSISIKDVTIFSKVVLAIVAIAYLILTFDLFGAHLGDYYWFYFFFHCCAILLPILLMVIFFMPWREDWLKLRWRLTMSFFLDLAYVIYIVIKHGSE